MGTRGAMGFRYKETDHITYNHFDSYPDGPGLGGKMCDFCADIREQLEETRAKVDLLQQVKEDALPTDEQVAHLAPYTDNRVSSPADWWYRMLRKAQGKPAAMLDARYYVAASDFLSDSLFCEYAYIVNLDTEKLECYRGFQDAQHAKGRYASCEFSDSSTGKNTIRSRWLRRFPLRMRTR